MPFDFLLPPLAAIGLIGDRRYSGIWSPAGDGRGSIFILWTVRRLNRRRPAPLPIFRPDRPVSRNLRPSRAIARALPDTGCHAQAAVISQPGSDIQQLAIVPQPSSASPRSPRSKRCGSKVLRGVGLFVESMWVVKRKRLTGASQARCVGPDGPAMAAPIAAGRCLSAVDLQSGHVDFMPA